MPFYQTGDVRIRYEETGSGFPLLVTPGSGLNSKVSNWLTAVFNAMEEFKNDFHCITMDQRNANGGESTGLVPTGNACDASPTTSSGRWRNHCVPVARAAGAESADNHKVRNFLIAPVPMRGAAQ